MEKKILKEEALQYHAKGRPGKIEVIPTKETSNQRDLSLAYSPGVADPCLEIADNVDNVYKYTAKGNLVAVISNGTAVLGLGDIGPEAGFGGGEIVCAGTPEQIIRNKESHSAKFLLQELK